MFKGICRFLSKHSSEVFQRKMAPARYFRNTMPDYGGTNQGTSTEFVLPFIEKITTDIEKAIKPVEKNGRDGLYLGTGGISYMYYHLSKIPSLNKYRHDYLKRAIEYISPALNQSNSPKDAPSFMLGNAGIYAMACILYQAIGDAEQSETFKKMFLQTGNICKTANFLTCGSDEFFVGRAGYILGALWLSKELNATPPLPDLNVLCKLMVDSGRQYSRTHNSPCPLMYSYYQVEYLGAAHGLCMILQVLLTVPGYLDANPSHASDVKASIDYLLSLQDSDGNFPCASNEMEEANELVHWCHGAPGMIYLMAKAFLLWNEEKYLNSCRKMGELIWMRGLLKKGPGICHGVAGNGYAFLLLYRLTQEEKYLYRAVSFAKFMQDSQFLRDARTPDYPFSLYEGVAGTACFLGDLLYPQQAQFPFSDVF